MNGDATTDQRAREYWHRLSAAEQRKAVFDLIDGGMVEYSVAAATGLSIEALRTLLAERRATSE